MRRGARAAPIAALAALLACGGGEGEAPERRPMAAQRAPEARTANRSPVVRDVRLDPARPAPGALLHARVDASDPDGDSIRLVHRWRVNGEPLAETGPALRLSGLSRDDRVAVEVVASDGLAESEPREDVARVANRPPELRGIRTEPPGVVAPGTLLTAVVDAHDPDGDPLRLETTWLVNGREREPEGPGFDTTGLSRGDRVAVRAVAQDGEDASRPLVSEPAVVGNAPPAITSTPPSSLGAAESFRYALEASDPDGDRVLRFELREGPEGMSLDPVRGILTWSLGAEQAGRHPVEVVVRDTHGGATAQRFQLTVALEETDAPPPASADH